MQQSLIWFRLDELTWVNPYKVTVDEQDLVVLHMPDNTMARLDERQSERVIDWLMDRDFDLRPWEDR